MPRYVAFLRAVNLGRNRRASGADLKAIFERLGFEEVAPFQTSGNVAFSAAEGHDELGPRIEAGLASALGFEVGVYLRSEAEVRRMAEAQPFDPGTVSASKGKLQVILLASSPPKTATERVLALATPDDLLAFGKRELYWLPSGGTLESALDRRGIDKLLGPTTTRTKATIERLAAKHFG